MKSRNILIVVEGKVSEVKVFNKIGALFFDKKTKLQFFTYQSNIYSLYQQIKKYKEFTSTIDILKEIAQDEESKKFLNIKFSEIYLVFDFDPQEPAYSDKKIKRLTSLFNDEMEFGKLYINYPMMESFRDHNNFNLNEYISSKINLKGLTSDKYKSYILKQRYNKNIDNFTAKHFKKLAKLNIIKTNNILNNVSKMPDFSSYHNVCNQKLILEKQIEMKNSIGSVYVLNTCMMFIVDYFGKKYYQDIEKA